MTVMDRDLSDSSPPRADAPRADEVRRQEALRLKRLRGRNLAVLAALLALVVLFYAITVVRMSAGH
ncbi:hypothetical protein [Azospirillum sp. TSO35-2]|uniref:hypothetical protein n=1 Tax=Azospirillum sp. TSO35-2 TaxID=716796 RepID=UPI000D61D9C3|nr:hypothetical protein [Azospirillum sp. TSO35-2]PWC37593.1 hypothetical protein TSO352_08650 [Azospirillum sp. TSO35-2]